MLVGVALVSLLSVLGAKRPVLCVVDDAQWLDSSSAEAIAFAARRISRDPIAFLFGARTLTDEVRGLPTFTISGLGDQDARTLLAMVLPDRLDDRVVDRLVVETHGNPLALLELPRGLTPAELAGGFGLPVSGTLAGAIEESYRRRLAKLPQDSRRLLLLAAADPTGDAATVWGAQRRASELATRRRPLSRKTDWSISGKASRSTIHSYGRPFTTRPLRRAGERHTWPWRKRPIGCMIRIAGHGIAPRRRFARMRMSPPNWKPRAQRAQGAGRCRGGCRVLERSVALTVDPARRAGRALRAVEAKRLAGALQLASGLAAVAERGPLDDLQQAQLDGLLGQIAFAGNRGNDAAPHAQGGLTAGASRPNPRS